jgi:DNA-binding transcriptional regulator YiaG
MTPHQLRQFRQRLRLTQAVFADCIGVTPNTVARWERGEINMRASTKLLIEMLMKNADLTKPSISAPSVEPATEPTEPTAKGRK